MRANKRKRLLDYSVGMEDWFGLFDLLEVLGVESLAMAQDFVTHVQVEVAIAHWISDHNKKLMRSSRAQPGSF